MSAVMTVLREQLLAGRAVAVDGPTPSPLLSQLERLGARVMPVPDDDEGRPETPDDLEHWVSGVLPLHAVVCCAAGASGSSSGPAGLQATLERTWTVVRAVACGALIREGEGGGGGGKIVLVAPADQDGELRDSVAAGLENLARTLSVEWARYGVTACAVVPERVSDEAGLAELVCFLVSPAGDYFSGCRFDLGSPRRGDGAAGTGLDSARSGELLGFGSTPRD